MPTPANCAQRLSASVMKTYDIEYLLVDMPPECSTPFGICDEDIKKGGDVEREMMKCSTPFGICDEDIAKKILDSAMEGGAQRLSASVMKTSARSVP